MKKLCLLISFFTKIVSYKPAILFIFLFLFIEIAAAQNLITNGDFESGGEGVGFQTNYDLVTGTTTGQKDYAIVSNPNSINTTLFSNACVDHTSGSGNMLVADGASSGSGGDKVWEAVPTGGIPVITGRVYIFSYWIQSISSANAAGNLADIEVRFNGTVLTPTSGSTICPLTLCSWTKVTYTWTATAGTAKILLYDNQTSSTGNDFALDDFSLLLQPLALDIKYSFVNPSCPNSTDGSITVYGKGGTPPYMYSLNGGSFISSGFFTGLAPSSNNYVSVKDVATPVPDTVTGPASITIVAPANPLVVRTDTAICLGASVNLSASGGTGGYHWTALPTDATLTTPDISNPVVSPVVTTTYTVASSITTVQNLIFNGDFSAGDIGFYSDYPSVPNNINKDKTTYGVVPNPNSFEPGFIVCTDHTTGTGNMIAVDGSILNGGTDRVWCQEMPVIPGRVYTFSYWIHTINSSASSPAVIAIWINGIKIQANTAPATSACGTWVNVSFPWNSLLATTAAICIIDENTSGNGNDFVIDDIAFTTPTVCDLTKTVTVTVSTPVTPIAIIVQPSCTAVTGSITVTTPLGTNIKYSIGGTYQSSPIFSGLAPNSYNLTAKDTITGCISPISLLVLTTAPVITFSTSNVSICPSQLPYSWNSNSYTGAGNYSVTLVNAAGCDSVATLALTLKAISSSTTNISICPSQLPYSWNSNSYTGAGNYSVILINAAGCDSVATIALTLKAISSSTTNVSICPSQLPYSWNSNSYTGAGNYSVTLINAAGCDSVATLALTLKATSSSTTNISICPSQLPYSWNSNSYTGAGNYSVTLINAAGCDSVATLALTLKTTSNSTTNVSICPSQLPYSWNSNSYTGAGNYSVTLINAAGCDSVATLALTLKATSSSTTNISICPSQLPYSWNSNSYTGAGNYSVTLINAAGCDSVATLALTLKATSSSTTNISICPSQLPYSWNSNSYTGAGNYSVTLINAAGCDSVATLVLTLKATSSSTTNISICPSQLPYSWNSNSYTGAGNYSVTLINAAGCDSVATLALTLKAISSSTTNISICPSQLPYSWNSNSYTGAGNYSVILINAAGCDSVATLALTLKAISSSTTNVSICPSGLPYSWNGNTYTGAGNYTVTLVGSSGCDSVATLILSVKSVTTSTTPVGVCPAQLPYSWNGNTYTGAGNYNITLVGSSGCDSVATLILSVKSVTTSTTPVGVCPAQLPYSWNGNTYTGAGNYTVTLVGSSGCDSVATLILSVKSVTTSTTPVGVCPAQLPYSWNGNTYTGAGNYTVTLVGSSGCDSVATLILSVKSVTTSTTPVGVCPAQLPYSWNGNTYTGAGNYSVTLINVAGCDSVATLVLTVSANSTSTTNVSVCPAQLPYSWNGNNYTGAGNYNITLVGSSGCDSIATLILSVKSVTTSTTPVGVCPAQLPYSWNGNTYTGAGNYSVTLINVAGCDSVATLVLTVSANSTSTTNVSVCPAQLPYSWNGNNYTGAGNYNITLVGSSGCDSVATLILSVKSVTTSTTPVGVCPAQLPYSWNGNNYTGAGNYTVTLLNAAGCDSVATLVLTVSANSTSTTNVSVCPSGLPYNWNGNNYGGAGNYNITLVGSSGCDSIATLILSVKSVTTSTTPVGVCPAQLPYSWNGNTYTGAGNYSVTLINVAGCDSVATLVLTVSANSTSTTNVSVCPSALPYNWNGNNYTGAGNYNITLVGSSGCDSIATLILSVKSVTTSTTPVGVCPAQLPYSWNGNTYTGAGNYSVTLINVAGCDSVATLVLTVSANSTSTTNVSVCPAQLPYSWNGNNYTGAGNYNITLVGSSGCDSIATLILSVKSVTTSTTPVGVCPAQLPYSWNGNTYTGAGNYSVTLINVAGCDSVATLVLTVSANSTSTTNVSVCPAQLPYSWNGNNYTGAGNYNITLVGSSGCDSVATLILSVKSVTTSTTPVGICPAQLPYSWNGNTYTGAGTYTVTLLNAAGCDSVATIVLAVKANAVSITNIGVCPAQLPYSWNGQTYTATGTYNVTLPSAVSCDSVATLVLTVNTFSTTTTNVGICPSALPYNWNGQNYAAAGTYAVTLPGSSGCDSIAKLILTLKANTTSTTAVNVCPSGLPYSWNGQTYNAAGTYTITLANAAGCDSVATLTLTVKAISSSSTTISVCPSALPYSWNGQTYNTAGTYTVTLANTAGCDSVATLTLTVKSTSSSTTTISVCPSALPYSWNGHSYNAAGTYTVIFTNAAGCDSVATIALSVKANSASTTTVSVCPSGLPYGWNGQTYNAAGIYTARFTNAAGCDSIATLVLTVKANSASTTTVSVCPSGLPYGWNGQTYNTAGNYTVRFTNAAGCDSIATLVLTVKATTTSTTSISICPSQLPYSWNGHSYNQAGSYTAALVNTAVCDSIASLVLSVKAVTTSTSTISVCASALPYSWNGHSYNGGGNYTVILTNAAGCDSIAMLALTIYATPVPLLGNDVVLCPGDSVILNPGNFESYLWQDFSSLPAFTVTHEGIYSVNVRNSDGCSGTASVAVNYLENCGDIYFPTAITPNGDGVNDKFGPLGNLFTVSNYTLSIYNRYGELVFKSNNPYQRWDAIFKQRNFGNVSFVWVAQYVLNGKEHKTQKGNLTVIR